MKRSFSPTGAALLAASVLLAACNNDTGSTPLPGGEDEHDHLGKAVDGGRDADGDGVPDVAIGAYRAGEPVDGPGAVYLVSGVTVVGGGVFGAGEVGQRWTGETLGDEAGLTVGLVGDLDGDGTSELVAASPNRETTASRGGVAYLFWSAAD